MVVFEFARIRKYLQGAITKRESLRAPYNIHYSYSAKQFHLHQMNVKTNIFVKSGSGQFYAYYTSLD